MPEVFGEMHPISVYYGNTQIYPLVKQPEKESSGIVSPYKPIIAPPFQVSIAKTDYFPEPPNPEIIVIGHKSPDTDAVCSAIAYARMKGYTPKVAGKCTRETLYVLKKFGIPVPESLTNVKGKKLILVDYNSKDDSLEGFADADVLKIIDHHQIKLDWPKAIKVKTKPVGATATIMAKKMLEKNIDDRNLAGIILCAIISDTDGFHSSTTTERDRLMARLLAEKFHIDLPSLTEEILSVMTDISGVSAKDLIMMDGKEKTICRKRILIGQIKVKSYAQVDGMDDALFAEMEKLKTAKKVESIILMETNIVDQSTRLLVCSPTEMIVNACGPAPQTGRYVKEMPHVTSRKADILPLLEMAARKLTE